jgi:hypothetical protein
MSDEIHSIDDFIHQNDDVEVSDTVILPVGLEVNGTRYREVIIDEMTGVDDHNLSTKSVSSNGAKGVSMILNRCIQEIPGYLEQKKDPSKLFNKSLAQNMTVVDRDYLISRIYMLGGENDVILAGKCPRCGDSWEEDGKLSEMEIVEWPEDKPFEIDFELPVGLTLVKDGKRTLLKKGRMRFPTGKDQERIVELGNPALAFDAMFAACIVQLGDLTAGEIDQTMMRNLKSRDRRYLMRHLQVSLPGLRQWKVVKCECGREFDINADLTAFFDGRQESGNKS